jgi:ABC-type spermidine/putrescine transport system permease subunit II
MPGAIFALIVLPLIIIGISVVLYYVSGKQKPKDRDRVKG